MLKHGIMVYYYYYYIEGQLQLPPFLVFLTVFFFLIGLFPWEYPPRDGSAPDRVFPAHVYGHWIPLQSGRLSAQIAGRDILDIRVLKPSDPSSHIGLFSEP